MSFSCRNSVTSEAHPRMLRTHPDPASEVVNRMLPSPSGLVMRTWRCWSKRGGLQEAGIVWSRLSCPGSPRKWWRRTTSTVPCSAPSNSTNSSDWRPLIHINRIPIIRGTERRTWYRKQWIKKKLKKWYIKSKTKKIWYIKSKTKKYDI